jgi:hypothetical protein
MSALVIGGGDVPRRPLAAKNVLPAYTKLSHESEQLLLKAASVEKLRTLSTVAIDKLSVKLDAMLDDDVSLTHVLVGYTSGMEDHVGHASYKQLTMHAEDCMYLSSLLPHLKRLWSKEVHQKPLQWEDLVADAFALVCGESTSARRLRIPRDGIVTSVLVDAAANEATIPKPDYSKLLRLLTASDSGDTFASLDSITPEGREESQHVVLLRIVHVFLKARQRLTEFNAFVALLGAAREKCHPLSLTTCNDLCMLSTPLVYSYSELADCIDRVAADGHALAPSMGGHTAKVAVASVEACMLQKTSESLFTSECAIIAIPVAHELPLSAALGEVTV